MPLIICFNWVTNITTTAMKRLSILMFAATAMLFASCEKDNESTDSTATTIQEDDLASNYFDEVDNEADELTYQNTVRSIDEARVDSGSRSVTVVTNNDGSKTKTVTYTSWINPHGNQSIIKNGKIIINIVGKPAETTFIRTITFENFTINGALIEGTKTITKTAQYQFTISCDNGKITFPDGKTYTRSYTRTRTWVAGYDTPFFVWDDIFTIEGSASGINRNGKEYTHTIVNPLQIKRNCRFIVSGTISIAVDAKTITLDYGTGTCDNIATITYNDKTTEIKLRGGQ